MNQKIINYTLADIEQAAAEIWQTGKDYAVWSFKGDMGAGKTTLIAALCRQLGVGDPVSSPTYAIVNEYAFEADGVSKTIYHCDWYRLRDAEEAREAGMEDCLYAANSYSFIEWASKAPELLLHPYLEIDIEMLSETERKAKVFCGRTNESRCART